MSRPAIAPRFQSQHGAALIIALILLAIMSLMVTTSLRGTIMQERMSSNTHDYNLAFQTAEAGLKIGESQVEESVKNGTVSNWAGCNTPNSAGLYKNINAACPQPLWERADPGASSGSYWHDANNEAGNISFNQAGLSLPPYYIVELISENAPCQISNPDASSNCRRFRITASSRSTDGRSQVILQSIYATE